MKTHYMNGIWNQLNAHMCHNLECWYQSKWEKSLSPWKTVWLLPKPGESLHLVSAVLYKSSAASTCCVVTFIQQSLTIFVETCHPKIYLLPSYWPWVWWVDSPSLIAVEFLVVTNYLHVLRLSPWSASRVQHRRLSRRIQGHCILHTSVWGTGADDRQTAYKLVWTAFYPARYGQWRSAWNYATKASLYSVHLWWKSFDQKV